MLKTPEITEEQGPYSGSTSAGGMAQGGEQSVQTRVKERFLGQESEFTPSKGASGSGHNVETPTTRSERRSVGERKFRSNFCGFRAQLAMNIITHIIVH